MIMSDPSVISLAELFTRHPGFVARDYSCEPSSAPLEATDLYSDGLADGQMMAETAFAIERRKLHALIASAQAIRAEDNAEIDALLDGSIRRIIHNIVGDFQIDAAYLEQQIGAATALLTTADQGRIIALHPDDFALLENADLPLPCKADPALPAGTMRIECSQGWIEHGHGFALQQLDAALNHAGGGV
jgi:flagellar assembly protein FliH